MALIAINDVYAGYGSAEILHGVNLTVEEGEIVTIIGPNGAGKSTLLKVVMGYLRPRVGEVLLRDKRINALRADQRVAAGLAYVPQLDNAFPSLTVAENLRMGGYPLRRNEVPGRIDAMYAAFPILRDRRRQKAGTLSGGQRQLLAMARALMTDPEIMLLDEPSAALSPQMAGEIFERVTEINKSGKTILIVEQEAQRSLEISDRGYVLVDGRNAYDGSARSILDDEKIRAAFLGSVDETA